LIVLVGFQTETKSHSVHTVRTTSHKGLKFLTKRQAGLHESQKAFDMRLPSDLAADARKSWSSSSRTVVLPTNSGPARCDAVVSIECPRCSLEISRVAFDKAIESKRAQHATVGEYEPDDQPMDIDREWTLKLEQSFQAYRKSHASDDEDAHKQPALSRQDWHHMTMTRFEVKTARLFVDDTNQSFPSEWGVEQERAYQAHWDSLDQDEHVPSRVEYVEQLHSAAIASAAGAGRTRGTRARVAPVPMVAVASPLAAYAPVADDEVD
jgi:hypothetical protein